MANGQDKILAIVCVLLLVLSVGYFYLTTSPEEEVESDDEVVAEDTEAEDVIDLSKVNMQRGEICPISMIFL